MSYAKFGVLESFWGLEVRELLLRLVPVSEKLEASSLLSQLLNEEQAKKQEIRQQLQHGCGCVSSELPPLLGLLVLHACVILNV